MSKLKLLPVGIDDMAFYTPSLYLPLNDLAAARSIPYEKLAQGLGTIQMAFPDAHEDTATMAAEAIAQLIERNQLNIKDIGRIYMGTESALDASKPTATYAVEMLTQRFGDGFRHCDVVDMTFACIGAVDALVHITEWVSGNSSRIGIVVASDFAKYDLESTGEYTQGAGAVAMLVRWQPRLMVLQQVYGVSCVSVHDFYKPHRKEYSEAPVFDGQYSNDCYKNRMNEAMLHFREEAIANGIFKENQYKALSERWARMVFHLPYSFHGKRMFIETYIEELKNKGTWEKFAQKYKLQIPQHSDFQSEKEFGKSYANFVKKVSETTEYQKLVSEKLEKAQRASSYVGNIYAASIFLALMSTLEADAADNSDLINKRLGFIAYGSGSKAKIFEGILQADWKSVAAQFDTQHQIKHRTPISYDQYLALHRRVQATSIHPIEGHFALQSIGKEGVTLGARYYAITSL
jgi:hydroxymethylglutaryl-CoA synthase